MSRFASSLATKLGLRASVSSLRNGISYLEVRTERYESGVSKLVANWLVATSGRQITYYRYPMVTSRFHRAIGTRKEKEIRTNARFTCGVFLQAYGPRTAMGGSDVIRKTRLVGLL